MKTAGRPEHQQRHEWRQSESQVQAVKHGGPGSLGQRASRSRCSVRSRVDGRALPSPAAIKAQIERRLHEVNAEMSPYLPDSAISQFNQLRDDRWFLLPPDFATVLREAVALHEVTQGGLDVSLSALVNLWGFGPEPRRDSPPPPDAIAARTSGMG